MRKVDALKKLAEELGIATAGTIKGITDAIRVIAEGQKVREGDVEDFAQRVSLAANNGGIPLEVGEKIIIPTMRNKKIINMGFALKRYGVVLEVYECFNGGVPDRPIVGTYKHISIQEMEHDVISEPICPNDDEFHVIVKQAPDQYTKNENTGQYRYSAAELSSAIIYYEDGTKTVQQFAGSRKEHDDIAKLMTEIDVLKGQIGGGA